MTDANTIRSLELRCLRLEEENERLRNIVDGFTADQRALINALPPALLALLTYSQSAIVAGLLSRGTVVAKHVLHQMTRVRKDEIISDKVIDVHISKMRKIFRENFGLMDPIITVWGIGYEASDELRQLVQRHLEQHAASQLAFKKAMENANIRRNADA